MYVDVVDGDRPVKFTYNLFYLEQDEDDEGEIFFHFKPTEVPKDVKTLEGKYFFEILDRNGDVWKSYGKGVFLTHILNPQKIVTTPKKLTKRHFNFFIKF